MNLLNFFKFSIKCHLSMRVKLPIFHEPNFAALCGSHGGYSVYLDNAKDFARNRGYRGVSFGWPLVANLWDEFEPRKLGVKDKRGFRLPRLRLPRGPRVRLPHLKVNVGADEAKTALKAEGFSDSFVFQQTFFVRFTFLGEDFRQIHYHRDMLEGSALILESAKKKQKPSSLN